MRIVNCGKNFLQMFPLLFWLVPIVVLGVLVYVAFINRGLESAATGSESVAALTQFIKDGVTVFIKRQLKLASLLILFLVVMSLIFFAFGFHSSWMILFIFTGFFWSGVAGFIGIKATTRACASFFDDATSAARAGSVVGLSTIAFATLDLWLWFTILNLVLDFLGFKSEAFHLIEITTFLWAYCLGASTQALFSCVGGGLFATSSGIASQAIAERNRDIARNDLRNPGTIADQVGHHVHHAFGLGAQFYETFVIAILVLMTVTASLTYELGYVHDMSRVILPVVLGGVCLLSSFVALFFGKAWIQWVGAAVLAAVLTASGLMSWISWVIFMLGVSAAFLLYQIRQFRLGFAGAGLAVAGVICLTILSYALKQSDAPFSSGLYGMALLALGLISGGGFYLSQGASVAVFDNAKANGEMLMVKADVQNMKDGNQTLLFCRSLLSATTSVLGVILFFIYMESLKDWLRILAGNGVFRYGDQLFSNSPSAGAHLISNLNITDIRALLGVHIQDMDFMMGLMLGASLCLGFCAYVFYTSRRIAQTMASAAQRQYETQPEIRQGTVLPDYAACIDESIRLAHRATIISCGVILVSPVLFGLIFGLSGVSGVVLGMVSFGGMLALSLNYADIDPVLASGLAIVIKLAAVLGIVFGGVVLFTGRGLF